MSQSKSAKDPGPRRPQQSDLAGVTSRFATVALSLPFKFHSGGTDGLTYSIPPELNDDARVGARVLVPLGKLQRTGVIVAVTEELPNITTRVRPITDVLDAEPAFDEPFLKWTKWIATYYLTSWGEVLAAALPEGLKPESKNRVFVDVNAALAALPEFKRSAPMRAAVLSAALEHPDGISSERLQKIAGVKSLHAGLRLLESERLVRIERALSRQAKIRTETVVSLNPDLVAGGAELGQVLSTLERQAPKQADLLLTLVQHDRTSPGVPMLLKALTKKASASAATFKALKERGYVIVAERERVTSVDPADLIASDDDISNISLTADQQNAVTRIARALSQKEPRTFLLHGITGSGKTEVYISLAREVLHGGGGVLILVPEIALTPQLIDRFRRRLSLEHDEQIAVLHSRLSIDERYAAWRSLTLGRTKLAIGARSAVFAPIKDLRLVIVDEEHEATYKQYDKTPRYHARDMAVVRAAMCGAVTVLGSATPSVESYHNAIEGKYELLKLRERAKQAQLPSVKVIDLRTATNRADFAKNKSALTPALRDAIGERLKRKEGIVLFQNRRGYATYQECLTCGAPELCKNCAVTMTFHQARNEMRCHYCGASSPLRTSCSTCGSETLRLGGMGTQRVEEDIAKAFPEARVMRMDLDTTSRKGAYKEILSSFASGSIDILLGTQMVAKGLDFPRVTLVGVVNADTSLTLADFRASERTFQMLTQVAGRAGRSLELAGEVLLQTLQPEHPAIRLAVQHDYETFYRDELPPRQQLMYPPFSRLILIEFVGPREALVQRSAERFATLMPARGGFYELVGPAPPQISKLRGEFRWHLLVKNYKKQDPNGEKIRRLLSGALEAYQKRFASPDVRVTVDVDVQGVM